jgi:glycerophosphoryl diester phosphodiesterase
VSGPTVIAHRGFAGVFPENTVRAARGAVERGADAIELDVQPTADGDVVVFHDRRLDWDDGDGLTDQSGVVWKQSTAEVTGASVLGTDEQVPLLRDVLTAIPDRIGVQIELKNPGSDAIRPGESLVGDDRRRARERWQPFVESVLDTAHEFGDDILYSSFCVRALAPIDATAPPARLGTLVAPNCADDGESGAQRYTVDAIHPPLELCGSVEPDWATVAADIGAQYNVWTMQDWQDARRAVQSGADGIIADYPGLC